MTKKERDAITRKIGRIADRVAKKRDELRKCLGEIEGIIESVDSASERMEETLLALREAQESLDRGVVDKLSEYV